MTASRGSSATARSSQRLPTSARSLLERALVLEPRALVLEPRASVARTDLRQIWVMATHSIYSARSAEQRRSLELLCDFQNIYEDMDYSSIATHQTFFNFVFNFCYLSFFVWERWIFCCSLLIFSTTLACSRVSRISNPLIT